jgi:hypothetical protein
VAIDFEQDTSMGEFASRGFAFGDQLVERVALLLAQGHFILMWDFLHGFLLDIWASLLPDSRIADFFRCCRGSVTD